MMRWATMSALVTMGAVVTMGAALASLTGCSLVGQGEGEVRSETLNAPDCWSQSFDLNPDFFATVPFRDTQQIRLQRGSDLEEVSDGVAILVHDIVAVRDKMLGQELRVGLSPELLAEVLPNAPADTDPLVSMALYLQFSCHNQNTVLYAIDGIIVFDSLFSGDPNETTGSEKFTDAHFEVTVADLRDATEGPSPAVPIEVPAGKESTLKGWFRFHFQRGQPGQPFP